MSSRAFKQANDMIRFMIKKNKSKSSLRVAAQERKIEFAVRRDAKNPREMIRIFIAVTEVRKSAFKGLSVAHNI